MMLKWGKRMVGEEFFWGLLLSLDFSWNFSLFHHPPIQISSHFPIRTHYPSYPLHPTSIMIFMLIMPINYASTRQQQQQPLQTGPHFSFRFKSLATIADIFSTTVPNVIVTGLPPVTCTDATPPRICTAISHLLAIMALSPHPLPRFLYTTHWYNFHTIWPSYPRSNYSIRRYYILKIGLNFFHTLSLCINPPSTSAPIKYDM